MSDTSRTITKVVPFKKKSSRNWRHNCRFGILTSVIGLTVIASSAPSRAQSGSLTSVMGPGVSNTLDSALPMRGDREPSLSRFAEAMRDVRTDPQIRDLLDQPRIHSLSVAQRVTSSDLETTKFQDYYKGIEVIGSMVYHQRGPKGKAVVNHIAQFDLDTHPTLTESQSVAIARSVVGDRPLSGKPELKILPGKQDRSGARLVYWVRLKGQGMDGARDIIIDAHSGKIVGNLSRNLQIAPIQIFSAKNQGLRLQKEVENDNDPGAPRVVGCRLTDLASGDTQEISVRQCRAMEHGDLPEVKCQFVQGSEPVMVKAEECQPGSEDDSVVAKARENARIVLNYFEQRHHRNSYDDHGSTVVSIIHAGVNYSNAYWVLDQNVMTYGDGNPALGHGSFANALDVAGHEMTHGVTASTAQLINMSENGALNEANSDFFGILIAGGKDWTIGKGIWKDPSQAKGIRDLANPGSLQFPAGVDDSGQPVMKAYPTTLGDLIPDDETCDSSNDNCWIHINATIAGHALYLITQAIGLEKAEHLQYAVLTQALGPGDTLKSAAESTKRTCDQIYDSSTCDGVRQAYAQVGL